MRSALTLAAFIRSGTMALWNRWTLENASVKLALTLFAGELEQLGNDPNERPPE